MSESTKATLAAQVSLDAQRVIGEVSPLLFGGFAEHLGRCVYEGIYDPKSPLADEDGLRSDVKAALEELAFTCMRYPGGNFVSGYDWLDGVGPREKRPRRRELAWQSIETNQFGLNEFLKFCQKIKTEPVMGVNFGTANVASAGDIVEYCNAPAGTKWADLRAAHGYADPYNIKYWCLGNEMDGSWQIGQMDAIDYAKKAREGAKVMRWTDPSIKTILCGSSGSFMSSFPDWDRTLLEMCWEQTDYLSLHRYASNVEADTDSFLAQAINFEDHVDTLAATIRYVKAKLRSKKNIYLSWDEWNVWYRQTQGLGGWKEAPALLEEPYNLEDALLVATWMSVFLRRCDVLKIACMAQIVNVIAPILTNRNGLVKQTIFYPFALFRKYAGPVSLDALVQSSTHSTKAFGDAPLLDASATYDPSSGRWAAFLVNRSQKEALPTRISFTGNVIPKRIEAIHRLAGSDTKLGNTFEAPRAVLPSMLVGLPIEGHNVELTLPPLSFSVVVMQ